MSLKSKEEFQRIDANKSRVAVLLTSRIGDQRELPGDCHDSVTDARATRKIGRFGPDHRGYL